MAGYFGAKIASPAKVQMSEAEEASVVQHQQKLSSERSLAPVPASVDMGMVAQSRASISNVQSEGQR